MSVSQENQSRNTTYDQRQGLLYWSAKKPLSSSPSLEHNTCD